MRRAIAPMLLCVAMGLALSCQHSSTPNDASYSPLPPVTLRSTLVYVERSSQTAFFFDLSTASPTLRSTGVGADAEVLMARTGHNEVLVLTRGTRDMGTGAAEPPKLTAIATDTLAKRDYLIGSPFNTVALTPDGRFALVFYVADANVDRLLFNPNEVAIVDLDAAPTTSNPVLRTVRSFGGIPTGVTFSPPLAIQGTMRTLAVVLSPSYVTLLDLANLSHSEITVRLTLSGDLTAVAPSQIVWDPDNTTAYLRGAASDDIYVLTMSPVSPDTSTGGNDFSPTINQLGVGHTPADMALFGDASNRRLLVAAPGSSEADVIDASSSNVTTIPLPAPADQVFMFQAQAPHDATVQQRALLYSPDRQTTSVSFLDLADVESRRGRNLETVALPAPIVGALPIPDQNVVLFQHANGAGMPGLSLLDLTQRTASPIFAEEPLAVATFGIDNRTLWVAPPAGDRVGWIDLSTFHPDELLLDDPVVQLIPLAGDTSGHNRVIAIHNGIGGYVTVIDGQMPSRETAISYRGFLFTDAIDPRSP